MYFQNPSFIHSVSHPFNKYLVIVYYVLGTMALGEQQQARQNPYTHELSLVVKTDTLVNK